MIGSVVWSLVGRVIIVFPELETDTDVDIFVVVIDQLARILDNEIHIRYIERRLQVGQGIGLIIDRNILTLVKTGF